MSTGTVAALKPVSTDDIAWEDRFDLPRFQLRRKHLSLAAMGHGYRVGVAIQELLPGKQSAPVHYHMLEEEHLYILEGALTVRVGAETHEMKAGDYICFPAGQRAGHCLLNNGDAVCRYLMVGERNPNDVVVYPDTHKVLVRSLQLGAVLDLTATRGYWDGEDTGLAAGRTAQSAPARDVPKAQVTPKQPISSQDVRWDVEGEGPTFGGRSKHLTYAALGSGDYHVGMLIESPAPGMRLAPRHYHLLEEEHALILEGQVTLLLGEERHELKPGDYVCFPAGQKLGHSFLNSGTGPCSYLMIGEHNRNDVCVLTDSNKMEVRALRMRGTLFDMSAVRGYLDGEEAS